MKKNYEKSQLILSITFFFLLVEIAIFVLFTKLEYKSFEVLSSTVITENYLSFYVDNMNLKRLTSNKHFYIENKRYFYEIIDITRKMVKSKENWYHEVIVRVELPKKYKDKDIVTISLYGKRKKLYTIFEAIWKE